MPAIYQLIYASTATVPFDQDQLVDLLEVSRKHNEKLGLTGILLYREGHFLQALEGKREDVIATYERILRDPRHAHCLILTQGEQSKRDFPDWTMGFRNLEFAQDAPPGFSQLLNFSLQTPNRERHRAASRLLLRAFKQHNLSS